MAGPNKDERKRLVRGWKESERAAREDALPLSRESLTDLRAHLAREFELGQACDDSCRITREWLEARAIATAPALDALLDLGAGCDCEVLANVQPVAIFGSERPPVPVPAAKPPRPPLPSSYEDEAMALAPQRPWRAVETRSPALLTLRLGKGGSGPTLNLLNLADASGDLTAWCRARWAHLHRQRWQRVRGDTDEEARARAAAEWTEHGFQTSGPSAFRAGAIEGVTVTVSSPRRTDAYEWFVLKLPRGARALELETEAARLPNDRRAVHDLIGTLSVKGPG